MCSILLVALISPSRLAGQDATGSSSVAIADSEPALEEARSMTAAQKLRMAVKDSFDWKKFAMSGVSTMYGGQTQKATFGVGPSGYAKRYGAAMAGQVTGTMITEGVLPALLHEDSRFVRRGSGPKGSRLKSALLQIVVTRTDAGNPRFNTSEWLGNAAAVGVSNLYYSDSRAVTNIRRLTFQIGTDSLSNVLQEFWPDIKQRFSRKHLPGTVN
jgi:hypothetical protein